MRVHRKILGKFIFDIQTQHGRVVGYGVADVFAERGESLPDNLFISAACPPHKTPHNEKVHLMEDEDLEDI